MSEKNFAYGAGGFALGVLSKWGVERLTKQSLPDWARDVIPRFKGRYKFSKDYPEQSGYVRVFDPDAWYFHLYRVYSSPESIRGPNQVVVFGIDDWPDPVEGAGIGDFNSPIVWLIAPIEVTTISVWGCTFSDANVRLYFDDELFYEQTNIFSMVKANFWFRISNP